MADTIRKEFNLTQQQLASWLGVNRTTLALVETGRRSMPLQVGSRQGIRLDLAALGLVMDVAGATRPAPAPLPPPPIDPALVQQRLRYCLHHAENGRYELESMRRQAAPYLARLAALPALRAWTGPVRNPEREQRWLASFEAEAMQALSWQCGAGPQRMLEARIAGLEQEAQLLELLLAELAATP